MDTQASIAKPGTATPHITNPNTGLSTQEAQARLAQDGSNALTASESRSALKLAWEVVSEPMFLLLVACGILYLLLGDVDEALMLLGFVFVVMGISFVQQRRTERSLEALRDLSSPRAMVVRDGTTQRIAGHELVCGDIVLLAEGDRVPADLELVEVNNLSIDESLLTGESVPVRKEAGLVYSGTLVTQGTARACVAAIGQKSALGRIGSALAAINSEATPIQEETRLIVKRVALVGLAAAFALALVHGVLTGEWLKGLLTGLTFAMAILPEELPVILTIFLGLGAWRLARENVLTRSIPAIELLGATTILCVDKTGTLTENRMAVSALWSPPPPSGGDAQAFDCTHPSAQVLPEALHTLLEYAVLASHRRAFDPMEIAIGTAGQRWLAGTEHLHADWSLQNDYPLSKDLLAMSRVWQSPDTLERMIAAKGAPEALMDLCHLSVGQCAVIAQQVSAMAQSGLRVLGVAQARFAAEDLLPGHQHDFAFEFLGLIALADPVRADVPTAIAQCHAAGIRVVMITGDHPATAMSIARQAGLVSTGGVLTGSELDAMDDATLQHRLAETEVFCRVQPEQKLRLVQAFRARGDVVTMTGDGVNDAPALKAADIGVAMGARGTDVAREAADLVLLKDDFASLLVAVRYGRRVFANLRKAIVFVVAVHVPIVGLSILPVLLGWPMLLMPVHILFLQLIIDPACSVVFEAEPLESRAMTVPPRHTDVRLFDKLVLARGFWQGLGLLGILLSLYSLVTDATQSADAGRTAVFMAMVLSNLGLIYANRTWGALESARSNASFGWIVLLTLVLLAAILFIPLVTRLFAFEVPTWHIGMGGVAATVLALGWFEAVKWWMGRRPSTRT